NDGSNIVRERLALLLKNGWQGLLLVALTTWAFFGFRYAFWIAMGLPVAFMGGIAVMATFGYSINMLTMVALLIVVGILMDDAIVISENIATKYESGLAPMDAAAKGVSEVMPGVLSSFLTTLCIFGSLAFLQGDIGQILRVVPVVMIAVLAASLVEAFLILPSHLGHALHGRSTEPGYVQQKSNDGIDWARERLIGRAARACVTARYLTLGVAFAALILAVSAMAGGLLKFSAFPDLDGDTLEARILLPQGTPLERTERVVDTVNAALDRVAATLDEARGDDSKLVRNRTVEFNKNKDAFETGPHVATISVDVLNSELRSVTNDALFAQWRKEVGQLPDVIALRFDEPATGPAGIAIDVRLKGRDLSALKAASVDMQTWFNRYDGVVDLLDDLRLGKPELRFRIKDEGSALGLRADDIANQVRAAFLGSTVDEIQTDRDFFEVDTRLIQAQRDKRQTLDEFVVMTSDGAAVPLSAVATIEEGRGFARINRIDGVRTVSVRGNVNPAIANANEIIGDMRARFLPGFTERHPDVTVSIAGQDAEAGKTQSSMISGFMLGLIGVYLVLSFQFRSYWEPVVVMILIPFAFIGAIVGHILMGIDFTMPSMLGFAALSGIVVNDSILLVNQIKDHHEPGATVADVAPSASQSRFRAIFLTSLTTVLGLTPLLLETSLQAQILIPLVTSLAFGLMASTILVLFVVPSFYAVLDDFGLTTLAKERKARDRESDLAGAAPAE
ncbi:MAG: efflux RND transporter permease subunit, partial [Pseudomonadota bacterium]